MLKEALFKYGKRKSLEDILWWECFIMIYKNMM